MARKKVTALQKEGPEAEGSAGSLDRPLLDLSDAAIKTVIHSARKRGYVTHDQIHALAKELNSEQIENLLSTLSGMGINVVDASDANEEEEDEEEAEQEEMLG